MMSRWLANILPVFLVACALKGSNTVDKNQNGLDAREKNTTCVAGERASGIDGIIRAFPNLTFSSPIALTQAPGDSAFWYVAEQRGVLKRFENRDNVANAMTFLDITTRIARYPGEGGLLGVAFHPNYGLTEGKNGYVYLSYTSNDSASDSDQLGFRSRISRFTANGDHSALDASSELILMEIAQPYENHNGGTIAFDADGLLNIGFGDGGNGGDPRSSAQNTHTFLGKMLRIDVNVTQQEIDAGVRYKIPPSNMFANSAPSCSAGSCTHEIVSTKPWPHCDQNCAEIFASGLRNPWKWSVDKATNKIWAGDVGQDAREEIDIVENGKNYGWNCREGKLGYANSATCKGGQFVEPVHDYDRNTGTTVIGGYVYRGTQMGERAGKYLFADYSGGPIWVMSDPYNNANARKVQPLLRTGFPISSFAEDNDGELYVVRQYGPGALYRLTAPNSSALATTPAKLSQTGCAQPEHPELPTSGMVPYDINSPLWSDGAAKLRWMALPDGLQIGLLPDGDFDFPRGTVLRKDFQLNNRLVETRLLELHLDGKWAGYSYQWDADGKDATYIPDGLTVARIAGTDQTWRFPNAAQCMTCHTEAAHFSIGPELAQLNRDYTYASTGRTANQIATLINVGLLNASLSEDSPRLVSPADETASVDERARAYLHANCSHCHRPDGGTPAQIDLRYTTTLAMSGVCNTPQRGDLGIANAHIVAPGDTVSSVLFARINRRGNGQMPPLGTSEIDPLGVSLIAQWITGLTQCP